MKEVFLWSGLADPPLPSPPPSYSPTPSFIIILPGGVPPFGPRHCAVEQLQPYMQDMLALKGIPAEMKLVDARRKALTHVYDGLGKKLQVRQLRRCFGPSSAL